MTDTVYRPIEDVEELDKLLDELPLALERDSFIRHVGGFPRRYFTNTSREEIVKHYLLMQSLGDRPVISSLSREGPLWKLVVIARERERLFARIAGALSYLGADITTAEAFGNRRSLVLDTFLFQDGEGRFERPGEKESLHGFLEDVIKGKRDLKPLIAEKLEDHPDPGPALRELQLENDTALKMTRMSLRADDHFGLLYEVSQAIADAGCNIEMAYIRTVDGEARDEFYLTCGGEMLRPEDQALLTRTLQRPALQSSG